MKKVMFIVAVLLTSIMMSCEKIENEITAAAEGCKGKGTLQVTNTSFNTLQRLIIDGVDYGTVDAGETKIVSLAIGRHTWQLVGISGGAGCTEAAVIIQECETSAFECAGK